MKKFLKLTLVGMVFATLGFGYSTNGKLEVVATGYKTAKKVGVSATFADVKFMYKANKNFATFLKSMNVDINALSVSVLSNEEQQLKSDNVAMIFKKENGAKSSKIMAKIVDVKGDDKKGMLNISITMNEVTKVVSFPYNVKDGKIMAKASINVLDFMLHDSFNEFAKALIELHENRSWTEVGLKLTIPFTK